MNGLINVYKEKGLTSHDVVYRLRKILGIKKIGHAGTLDPEAEGVLVIGVNKGTKLMEYIGNDFKVYEGELVFGLVSTTEDIHGELEEVSYEACITREMINEVFSGLSGKVISQKPPMYSSVKVKGRKLYQYARAGIEVDRKSRNIEIVKIETISGIYENHGYSVIKFRAMVSKGTYIRTLCVHIGELIGVPCVMGDLLRTEVGNFKIENSFKLDEVSRLVGSDVNKFLLPLIEGIRDQMFQVDLKKEDYDRIRLGQNIENKLNVPEGSIFAGIFDGRLVSILTVDNGVLRIIKNIGE